MLATTLSVLSVFKFSFLFLKISIKITRERDIAEIVTMLGYGRGSYLTGSALDLVSGRVRELSALDNCAVLLSIILYSHSSTHHGQPDMMLAGILR